MDILTLLCVPFAANSIVTAWLYGSIFNKPRKYFEDRPNTFFGELMLCPLCISYHVSFWTTVLLYVPGVLLPAYWNYIPLTLLYALAAVTPVHFIQGELPIETTNAATPDDTTTT